jgi:glycosyltransferase involved in cell wall biosynthesis
LSPLKISIITVSYNSAATIADTLHSFNAQDYKPKEHILIDGASQDETLAVIARHRHRDSKLLSEPDGGIYEAMNKGIDLACGEVIGFLNADDIYAGPQSLTEVAARFADPKVQALYADLVYVKADNLNVVQRYWQAGTFKKGRFGWGWSPPHPTFFVRKAIYQRYGGFDLTMPMGNDIELMLRLLERYEVPVCYLPQILIKMRSGGVSNRSVRNIIIQNRAILAAFKQNNLALSPIKFCCGKLLDRLQQCYRRPTQVSYER